MIMNDDVHDIIQYCTLVHLYTIVHLHYSTKQSTFVSLFGSATLEVALASGLISQTVS